MLIKIQESKKLFDDLLIGMVKNGYSLLGHRIQNLFIYLLTWIFPRIQSFIIDKTGKKTTNLTGCKFYSPNLGLLDIIWVTLPLVLYLYQLDIVPSYHPTQFKRKLMNQTSQKKAKNLILGPMFACLAQIWAPEIYSKGFTSTNSQILFQAIIYAISKKSKLQKMMVLQILPLLVSRHCSKLLSYVI